MYLIATIQNHGTRLTAYIEVSEIKANKSHHKNFNSLTASSESPGQMALRLVDEFKDHERRKMNLIFHKIPEQEATENTSKHELEMFVC